MARPPSDNPASDVIRMRVTPADKAMLVQKAEAARLTLTAYLLQRGLASS